MANSDPRTPNVDGEPQGRPSSGDGDNSGDSDRYKGAPSSDFLASVHTVEVDNGDHREKRSLSFYRTGTDRKFKPGDETEVTARVMLPADELERLGADPDEVFTVHIRPDANVDAEPGSIGAFEKLDAGRVRYLGTMEELGGERVPLDD
jgi:hypothetical protein